MYRIVGELPEYFTLCDLHEPRWEIRDYSELLWHMSNAPICKPYLGAHVLSQQWNCES